MYFCTYCKCVLKLKKIILIVCLFAVLATKTFSIYASIFTDVEIEQCQELDEEDTSSDGEDPEKETTETDIFYTDSFYSNIEIIYTPVVSLSKFHFYIHRYISPTKGNLFAPPELC